MNHPAPDSELVSELCWLPSASHTHPRLVCLAALVLGLLFGTMLLLPLAAHAQRADDSMYLPTLARDRATPRTTLVITSSTTLSQDVDVDLFVIVPGVTVTAPSTLTVRVRETMHIGGALVADCHPITLHAQRTPGSGILPSVIITGTVDNRCADPMDEGGDLTIWSENGELQIGLPAHPADVQTSGDLVLANDDLGPTWPYALLPEHAADTPRPPACTIYADTLVDVIGPDSSGGILPATFTFFAEGVDPNLGPVRYDWDFGNGTAEVDGPREIEYSYWVSGLYTVTVTVHKEYAALLPLCRATLTVLALDGMAEFPPQPEPPAAEDAPHPEPIQPAGPALSLELLDIALPVGAPLHAHIAAIDAYYATEELTYLIDWGDGTQSSSITEPHAYAASGVYTLAVTVTNPASVTHVARGAVYVYTGTSETAASAIGNQNVCVAPPVNAFFLNAADMNNPPAAGLRPNGDGRNGGNITLRGRGDLIIAPGVLIRGQNGGDGAIDVGGPLARSKRGGHGGSLTILAGGRLTMCNGVVLEAGSGGAGGDATALAGTGETARAYGGRGGRAANRLWLQARQGIDIVSPNVTLNPGNGGLGGTALAIGGNGEDRCPAGQDGGSALATGGNGGSASKVARIFGPVTGVANVTLVGGLGGDAGGATARGGAGGIAQCDDLALGGNGGDATARGGHGGPARQGGQLAAGFALAADAFTAGDGGVGNTVGGEGGSATATPSDACMDTQATGGAGGRATAYGGNGASGRIDGEGGYGVADGGRGGNATAQGATGGDCTPCEDGGNATARGGNGGSARALNGRLVRNADEGRAVGGNGGDATATGGDCPEQGNITAQEGQGGPASGSAGIESSAGEDGNAAAPAEFSYMGSDTRLAHQ